MVPSLVDRQLQDGRMSDAWIQKQLQLFQFSFDEADKDKNGSLSFQEVYDVLKAGGFMGTEEEASAIFKRFDWNKDKKITRSEFILAMRSVPKMSVKEFALRKIFQALDQDRSGYLNNKEIMAATRGEGAGLDISKDQLMDLFSAIAKDTDGRLYYEEFLRVFKVDAVAAEMRAIFTALDADKSGFLTRKEIHEALKADFELSLSFDKITDLLSYLVTDDDKKISYEEFLSVWQKQKEVRK